MSRPLDRVRDLMTYVKLSRTTQAAAHGRLVHWQLWGGLMRVQVACGCAVGRKVDTEETEVLTPALVAA